MSRAVVGSAAHQPGDPFSDLDLTFTKLAAAYCGAFVAVWAS